MTITIHHSMHGRAQSGALNETTDPDPEVLERARGPHRYSAKCKAQILDEYERLDKAGKGALLRREGLYTSLISEWRKQRDRGALEALAKPAGRQPAHPCDREAARLRGRTSVWRASSTGPARSSGPRESSRRCWSSFATDSALDSWERDKVIDHRSR